MLKLLLYILLFLASLPGQAQIIITYAGTGAIGFSGDGGPATAAQFQELIGIATDTAGNLFIPDYNNNVVRKVDTGGIITTIAGTTIAGYSGDGGPATTAKLDHPWNVTVDLEGNVYIAEQGNNTIRKINTAGMITTFAGNGFPGYSGDGDAATAASFNLPWGIALADSGNIFITDAGNHAVRKINAAGVVTTIAGNGTAGYNGDNILASTAELASPTGLLWTGGKLYVADKLNNRIRRISGGIITTAAGTGVQGYSSNGGPATAARLNSPVGLAADESGNIYLSDFGNNMVRKMTGTTITTIAGNGTYGSAGDGGHPLLAELAQPWGVATGKEGSIYVADKNNYKVRKIYTPPPPPSGVRDLTSRNISVYPNPAINMLNIVSGVQISSVQIFGITGQSVYTGIFHNKRVGIDISSWPSGIYLLHIDGAIIGQFTKI